jgi:hypothetical protein
LRGKPDSRGKDARENGAGQSMVAITSASQQRRGRRAGAWACAPLAWAALVVAGASGLAGCSSTIDHIPTAVGGLPQGIPARPAEPGAFPAVHDMPPRRENSILNEVERRKLRDELAQQRERAARETAAAISADPTGATVPAATP